MAELPIKEVASAGALSELLRVVADSERVGLDTEFHGEETYIPSLMLVQVATEEAVWLVDPLADIDMRGLAEALARPGLLVIGHALRQDLSIFSLRWGIELPEVFDTQIAAAFAGWGRQMGLSPLLEKTFDVQIDKGYQRADWSVRPLPAGQARYAADDVRWLLPLQEILVQALGPRLPWVLGEGRELVRAASTERDPERAWLRVRGSRKLTPRQSGVLQAVAAERERLAVELDRTPHFLLPNDCLLALTEKTPTTPRALAGVAALRHRIITSEPHRWIEAVQRGLAAPHVSTPRLKAAPEPVAVILRVVREAAEELGIDPSLLVQRKQAEAAVRHGDGVEGAIAALEIDGWRGVLLTDRLRSALAALAPWGDA